MKDAGKLIGPFTQLITMRYLALKGALRDSELEIIENAGVFIRHGEISEIGDFRTLKESMDKDVEIKEFKGKFVALPGFIDCHTHIAFGGNRANDFAMRNAGRSYLEIAHAGGGIWNTVKHTRACSQQELKQLILKRTDALLRQGITTIEVKSGYGLSLEEELKTLRAIKEANSSIEVDLISTCLAAHMHPRDHRGTQEEYLDEMIENSDKGGEFYSMLKTIDKKEKSKLIKEVLNPYVGSLMVTPKDVDTIIEAVSRIISNGINLALQPDLEIEDINKFMN